MTGMQLPTAYYCLVDHPIRDEAGHEYWGVDRPYASHGSGPWEDSPAREVWIEQCSTDFDVPPQWDGFFPSVDIANHFKRQYLRHGYRFEIIEVHPCYAPAHAEAIAKLPEYFGLDVATTEPQSVLVPSALWSDIDYEAAGDPLNVLWALPPKYFRRMTNNRGLLCCYQSASLFRDVMLGLQRIDDSHQSPKNVLVMGILGIPS